VAAAVGIDSEREIIAQMAPQFKQDVFFSAVSQ
jgi:hypothetical protein